MKLIRESDDFNWNDDGFEWAREIEIKTDLTPAQILHRYNTFQKELVGPYIAEQFNDIYFEGGELILRVNHWEDLVDLFRDTDSSYGMIGRGLAKLVLGEDDYWEPYYDIVQNWKGDVWDLVTDDSELLEYIKKYIKKNYIVPVNYNPNQIDIFGETPKKMDVVEIDGRVLDVDFYNEIIQDNDYLGDLIDDEDVFQDLKDELRWAYESSYNGVARDNVWKAAYEAIKGEFGVGDWVTIKNSRGYDENLLRFNVTTVLLNSVSEYISDCFATCRRYFDPERHYNEEEQESEEMAFEEYCEECIDSPFNDYSNFVSFYSFFLSETSGGLYPSYDEYPSGSELSEYFREDVYSRI